MKLLLEFIVLLTLLSCSSHEEISNRVKKREIEVVCSSETTFSLFLKQCDFRDFIVFAKSEYNDSTTNCDDFTQKLQLTYENDLAKVYKSKDHYKIESKIGKEYLLFESDTEIQFVGAKTKENLLLVSFKHNDYQYVIHFRKKFIDIIKYDFFSDN